MALPKVTLLTLVSQRSRFGFQTARVEPAMKQHLAHIQPGLLLKLQAGRFNAGSSVERQCKIP